jgi:hypothetical protein
MGELSRGLKIAAKEGLQADFEIGHAPNPFDCAFSQLAGQREDICGDVP